MKFLIVIILLIIGGFCQAQKITIDTLNNTKTTVSPAVIDNDLCETVIIQKDDKIVWSGIDRLKTCKEFKQFKKDYPLFQIPKRVLIKFKCK